MKKFIKPEYIFETISEKDIVTLSLPPQPFKDGETNIPTYEGDIPGLPSAK